MLVFFPPKVVINLPCERRPTHALHHLQTSSSQPFPGPAIPSPVARRPGSPSGPSNVAAEGAGEFTSAEAGEALRRKAILEEVASLSKEVQRTGISHAGDLGV